VRRQPDSLLPDDVADLAASIGLRIDRRNVTRALEHVPVPGVVPPPRRGVPWTIPRTALVQVFAACLRRRALRELAPMGLRPRPLQHYEAEAARRMLRDPALAALVPAGLRERMRRDEQARRRAERRREEERRRAAAEAAEAARRRAQARREAEERLTRAWEAYWRAERRHRHLGRAYGHAKRLAYLDLKEDCARRGVDGPVGRDWPERFPQFVADWPTERPLWWVPPPGMLEAVIVEPTTIPYGYVEPDWRRWVPPYVPGRPWPWRDDDYRPPRRPA
jgi:hypothetical protein